MLHTDHPPRMRALRPLLAGLLATAALAGITTTAEAKPTPTAELRVLGEEQAVDTGTWYALPAGKVRIDRARDNTNCEPRGRRSPEAYPIRSALGALGAASLADRELRPLRVQSYDFGPLVCSVAGIVGQEFNPDDGSYSGWNYYVDFAGGASAADEARVGNGDRVLWALADQDTGSVLRLSGIPASSEDGSVTARVQAYGLDGEPEPVDDATIDGVVSSAPLGDGRYSLTLAPGRSGIVASRGDDIDSNLVEACSEATGDECPAAFGRTVVGSRKADVLKGTRGEDVIRSGKGNDRVRVTQGGEDAVNCGAGRRDLVVLSRGADVRTRGCEKVNRVRG